MSVLFPPGWATPNPKKKRSKHAVVNDRWDRDDLKSAMREIPPLSAARDRLGQFADSGKEAVDDAFWALLKAEPELHHPGEIEPSHIVNRQIVAEMLDLPETEKLRRYSVNDEVQAALSAAVIEPDLETLLDRAKHAQKKAEQLQQAQDELSKAQQEQADVEDMIQRWSEEHPDEPAPSEMADQHEQAQQATEAAEQQVQGAAQAVEQALERARIGMSQGLQQAMGRAAEEAQTTQEAARSFGMEPGELQRVPAQKRIELAKRLNNPRFKRIADLFGAMRNLLIAEQARKVTHHKEEVYDVGIGNDLGRVLPQELMNLREGPTRLDFLRRFAEGKLLQYEMKGTEKLARGAIIYVEDGSGSMQGEREMWSKAVGLALLHFARQQNRAMHIIHFSGPGRYRHFSFTRPDEFSFERILESAEMFYGGGPLRVDQRVATPSGWRQIGQLEAGDEVFGPDGKPTTVLGVFPQGELDLYRVTFSDGVEVVCDGSHRWTVQTKGNKAKTWRTFTLNEMLHRGLRYEHQSGGWYRFNVPITKPLALPEAALPVDPYLLGYMIGNGSFTTGSPTITSAPGDEAEWMKVLPSRLETSNWEKREGFCPVYGVVAGRQGGNPYNPLVDGLRQVGLWGVRREDKFIPDEYLWASMEQRWALLQGLLDSDGTLDKPGRVCFSSASAKLAEHVAQLAHSLGCLARMHAKAPSESTAVKDRSNESHQHVVEIRIAPALPAPFRLERYTTRWSSRQRFVRSIEKAEPIGRGEAICIKVDREDGLFLTEGMVVTHNTDYATPMRVALSLLRDEYASTGRTQADVVFASDGECYVQPAVMEEYLKELDRMGSTTWAISIGNPPQSGGPLAQMSENKVCTVQDLLNGGEIRQIFRGI